MSDEVHAAAAKMGPQLWHMGVMPPVKMRDNGLPPVPFEDPSERVDAEKSNGHAMTESDIANTIVAFGSTARSAKELGFDLLELHRALRYLIDQFFWSATNIRSDKYGGASLAERTRFAVDVIHEVRRQVGGDLVVQIRLSQWKPGPTNSRWPPHRKRWSLGSTRSLTPVRTSCTARNAVSGNLSSMAATSTLQVGRRSSPAHPSSP